MDAELDEEIYTLALMLKYSPALFIWTKLLISFLGREVSADGIRLDSKVWCVHPLARQLATSVR